MASKLDSVTVDTPTGTPYLKVNWVTLLIFILLVAGIGYLAFTLSSNLTGDPALATNGNASEQADSLDQQMIRIADRLQCPICEGQSVAFSGSQLAAEMRRLILQKLEAGESEAAIMRYFIDRYGVKILREPPKTGWNLWLWIMPILGVAAGLVGLTWRLRQMSLNHDNQETTDPFLDTPEVRELLAEYDKDLFQ